MLEGRSQAPTRHVLLLECRINGCSQCGCIGESWCRLFIAGVGDSLKFGQGMSRDKIGRKLGVCGATENAQSLGDTRISSKKKTHAISPSCCDTVTLFP